MFKAGANDACIREIFDSSQLFAESDQCGKRILLSLCQALGFLFVCFVVYMLSYTIDLSYI